MMSDLIFQVHLFASEILILIDQGKCISLTEFEQIMDEKRIVQYIEEEYGFKNRNSTPENQKLVQQYLNETVYVSENEAYKIGIENNGFVYLLSVLMDFLERTAYDYKWNYEELASDS